ncbi:uncharacterized protein BXZ73DRAFT_102393 [Epithele typhae]|uniref:uncharacterized protein n=1 Tax=Epithele typhae TaxID=378194 RepID=UPI002008AAB0|nr:uncharacterized protein BXZ73DRAFT_102393 [Epithele typhae]KAH9928556.1 hypothetical protein BXZ73DRAFT_102393 [Epithele typhae]
MSISWYVQTIDDRYDDKRSRRSSFALSDIFELDEEEAVDIEISPILPPSPSSGSSISTTDSVKSRVKAVFSDIALVARRQLRRVRSANTIHIA